MKQLLYVTVPASSREAILKGPTYTLGAFQHCAVPLQEEMST